MVGIECIGNSGDKIYSIVKTATIDKIKYYSYLKTKRIEYNMCKKAQDIEQAYKVCEEAFYEAEKYGYKIYRK